MGKVLLKLVGSSEKEIHWERTIHSTDRRGFLVEVGPNNGLTSATLNALEPDLGDNPSRESSTDTRLQRDSANCPRAIYMPVKTGCETPGKFKKLQNGQRTKETMKSGRGIEPESIDTVQMTRGNQTSTSSELSSAKWQTDIPAIQEKKGITSHTLHERRPLTKNNTQQSSPTDYTQQTEQQRKNLHGRIQETERREAIYWQEISTPASSNLPFFAFHGEKDQEKARVPREHRKRAQLHEGDRHQAENTVQAEQLIRDAKKSDSIKNAWIKVIQAENELTRDSAAFIPKVRLKETNPTFKHPEN